MVRLLKSLLRNFGIAVIVVGAPLLALLAVFGVMEPDSRIGYLLFRTVYALPSTRSRILEFYHWSIIKYEGGYMPSQIDEYLVNRLANCGRTEETAITDFEVNQTLYRQGDAASQASESSQKQMISNIMGRLDSMEDVDAVNAMEFIETLRIKDPLHKGGFDGMWSFENGVSRLNRENCEKAKTSFKNWWHDGSGWPTIRKQNPLQGTGLVISGGA